MKKVILMAAVAVATMFATMSATAQDKKFWVGGSFGFDSAEISNKKTEGGFTSLTTTNADSFSILPEFGINLNDRWALGIQGGYEQSKIKNAGVGNEINGFSVAPFARYTFLKWKAFDVFADGGFNYLYADGKMDSSGVYSNVETNYGGIFITPGVSLRLSDHFALTGRMNIFSAGYTKIAEPYSIAGNIPDETKSWNASLNSPFKLDNITLGVNFRF